MYLSTFPRHRSQSPFAPEPERPIEHFEEGDRVTHTQHGLGRVVVRQGSGVSVEFGTSRVWITSPFPGLSKL